jgi:hypothetical protein
MGQMPGMIHDYHDLLGGGRPGGMPVAPPLKLQEQMIRNRLGSVSLSGANRAYREWLDFRRAQANGATPSEVDSFWNLLHDRLVFLPREVKECIEKRRAPLTPTAEPVAPAPALEPALAPIRRETQPVEELIAALEAVSARMQGAGPANAQNHGALEQNTKRLLGEWKAVAGAGAESAEASSRESAGPIEWRALAEQPDSLTLFALREKAVRFVLTQLPAHRGGAAEDKAVPVRKALAGALEKCALDGDWPGFHRVLSLDSAAGLLAGADHLRWKEIGDTLEQAAGEQTSSPETARGQYATVVELTDSAAITALVARRLKELPVERARP